MPTTRKRSRTQVDSTETAGSSEPSNHGDESAEGPRDPQGRLHGLCTVHHADGAVFKGSFVHGSREGGGTLDYPDGSRLEATYAKDTEEGDGKYVLPDGHCLLLTYRAGTATGPFKEFDEEGNLTTEGEYSSDGKRCGTMSVYFQDGGVLHGTLDDEEAVAGPACCYIYPDGRSCLAGSWEEGAMKAARFLQVEVAPTRSCPLGEQEREAAAQACGWGQASFCYDPGSAEVPSLQPRLQDPYEAERVHAMPSTVPDAGEGLFAKRALEAGEVVSFYSGVRLPQQSVDARTWEENGNVLTVDEEEGMVVDVPQPWDRTERYCASLGHKANHAFDNNAVYDGYEHPRFGLIKCIRAVRKIALGEEIFVRYDYDHGEDGRTPAAPDWYCAALQRELERGGSSLEFLAVGNTLPASNSAHERQPP